MLGQLPGISGLGLGWEQGWGGCWNGRGREGKRLLRNATRFTQELCVGVRVLGKRTTSQETPVLAIALALPRCVTSLANSALVSTPVKWGDVFF